MASDFDFQAAFARVEDRITSLHVDVTETKTKVTALVGNGQPGEITLIKDRLTVLEEVKNKAAGYATAIVGFGTLLGVAGHFLVDLIRGKH